MKTTLFIYIAMGILFVVPLILFNIKKIWVRKPPNPVKFKLSRFIVITVLSVFIITFLVTAYQETIKNRYEIWSEKIAEKQSEMILDKCSISDFKNFIVKNGTDTVAASFDTTVFPEYSNVSSVKFQFSSNITPNIWKDKDYFEQVPYTDGEDNPIYVLYMIQVGEQQDFYVIRLKDTDSGWKYDWIGNETDIQKQKLNSTQSFKLPNDNGKWFTVER